ncbi:DUF932 domain-containing protein [Tundrisphaera sp. TA3]|uniref:DUF932 domain-containing protein n=1 Tax=Tundrisphaera sp. TA3 TaxID=3435775 RepID=UPI003EBAF3C8
MTTAILSTDSLRTLAPSIFATTPWAGVGPNYRFVPSIDVLGMMADQGFHPVMASQSRSRIPGKGVFTKHLVRLRHRDHVDTGLHAEVPELVLVNSHDRTSAYKIFAGILRTVCSNGLVVCSEDYGSFSLRHSGSRSLRDQIIETTGEVIGVTRKAFDDIREWKGITLTRPQQLALANAAMEIKPNDSIRPAHLLTSRREEDDIDQEGNRDLYRTTNVLQENLIRGGIRGRNARGRKVSTRPVKSVTGDLAVNRALWRLADEMSRLVK